MFPYLRLGERDIESSWAGLRPLIYEEGKSPSEVSRRDEIFVSPSGLITIAGGKLTGYRKMAETVVDRLAALLRADGRGTFGPCATRELPISGGDVGGSESFAQYAKRAAAAGEAAGLTTAAAQRIASRYGSNAKAVFERIAKRPAAGGGADLSDEDYGMLMYAIEEEMAAKPADFLIRRTGALFFDIGWVRRNHAAVIACMADALQYTEAQRAEYAEELERELKAASEI